MHVSAYFGCVKGGRQFTKIGFESEFELGFELGFKLGFGLGIRVAIPVGICVLDNYRTRMRIQSTRTLSCARSCDMSKDCQEIDNRELFYHIFLIDILVYNSFIIILRFSSVS